MLKAQHVLCSPQTGLPLPGRFKRLLPKSTFVPHSPFSSAPCPIKAAHQVTVRKCESGKRSGSHTFFSGVSSVTAERRSVWLDECALGVVSWRWPCLSQKTTSLPFASFLREFSATTWGVCLFQVTWPSSLETLKSFLLKWNGQSVAHFSVWERLRKII